MHPDSVISHFTREFISTIKASFSFSPTDLFRTMLILCRASLMPALYFIYLAHSIFINGQSILDFVSTFAIGLPCPSSNLIKLIR